MQKIILTFAFFAIIVIFTSCAPDATIGEAAHKITIGAPETEDPYLHELMLGVISGPEPTANGTGPTLTKEYQDIGVVSIRNNDYYDDRLDLEGIFNCGGNTYPSWEGCDANDDANYDWTKSDAQYQSYIDGGFIPFLRIGGEWENQANGHDFKGPQNATQEANWIIAANKMVDRYENWSAKPNAFTYLNIWTEYPGGQFWDRSNPDFIKFWVNAYKSIKAAHPELKVGGPGFVPGVSMKVSEGDGSLAESLLQEMYKQNLKLDWFGWHTFGSDPTVYAKIAQGYQDLLDGTGAYKNVPWSGTSFFADTEVFVDAYGNGTGEAGKETAISVSTARGAAVLTAGWISLQYADIQGAFYYRGNDQGSPGSAPKKGKPGRDNSTLPGLFTSAGEYKPAADAFRLWSQLTNNYETLLSISDEGRPNEIWTLAAKNSSGEVAVLVANPSDTDTTISINSASSVISIPAGAVKLIEL